MSEPAVYFLTSDDDFIAAQRAREIFQQISADADDMSKETIDGNSGKASDSLAAVNRAMEAAQTLSMFGGAKFVWLKNVNFINDTSAGKSKTLTERLEAFAEFLKKLDASQARVVISATNIDRRKKFFKELQKFAECEDYKADKPIPACTDVVERTAARLGIKITPEAAEALARTVAGNTRMALSELDKLATYTNMARTIEERDVIDMVPIFGEGEFFDITNSFYDFDLPASLSAIRRYFFANKNASARPILSALQKQNSLLIQLRAMMDSGALPKTPKLPRGALEAAAAKFGENFEGLSPKDKTNLNVFSQNPSYAGGRLASLASKIPLKKLIDFKMNFVSAFTSLVGAGKSDESVMRDLFVRCLAK